MPLRHDEILGLLPRLNFGPQYSPGLWLFAFELVFWLGTAMCVIALLRLRPLWLDRAEQKLSRIAQHQKVWLAVFPLSVILLRTALLPWIPVAIPTVHDEFSYLLASDTFAHGRLSNPPSPMWEHFESFHINVRPTYQSMYPPGQGLSLALGQVLTGVPWAGVVLGVALMCAAVYWMLLGWLPPQWAWLGGAFAVIRFGTFSYWINSYWGGSVAAIGGALLLGALPRLRKDFKTGTLSLFAGALLILAFSRPLEGFAFSVVPTIAALFYLRSNETNWRSRFRKLAPAIAILVLGAVGMLYYNWRGTGHPLLMPYAVNFQTYHISKPFFFEKPNPVPEYHHQVMRSFYVFHELPDVLRLKYESPAYLFKEQAAIYYSFFLWPLLLLVTPTLYTMWRSEMRVVIVSVGLLAVDLMLQIWPPHAHYAAPATGAFILMGLYSLRHFRNSHSRIGARVSQAVAMMMVVCLLSPLLLCLRDPYSLTPRFMNAEWREPGAPFSETYNVYNMPLQIERQRLQADLERRPGKHLVIVHHPYHDVPSIDWIYNDADLASSKVIWARDMGYLKNQELLKYYADRQIWFVDRLQRELIPYEQAMLPWKLALDSPPFGPASDQGILAKADNTPAATPKPQIAVNSSKEQILH